MSVRNDGKTKGTVLESQAWVELVAATQRSSLGECFNRFGQIKHTEDQRFVTVLGPGVLGWAGTTSELGVAGEHPAPEWMKSIVANSKFENIVFLMKAQDIVVVLKLAVSEEPMSFAALAEATGMSLSQVHGAVQRATRAGLLSKDRRVNRAGLLEFLVHGVKYVFPAVRGPVGRGMPTAHAAAPLAEGLAAGSDLPPVWPDPEGRVRGEGLRPLHRSALVAAKKDQDLYEVLALVDALRAGRARERHLAESALRERFAA